MLSEFWRGGMLGKALLEYRTDGKMTLRYLLGKCVVKKQGGYRWFREVQNNRKRNSRCGTLDSTIALLIY